MDEVRHIRSKDGRKTLCGAAPSEVDLYYDAAKKAPPLRSRCPDCHGVLESRRLNPGHPIATENLTRCPVCGGVTSRNKIAAFEKTAPAPAPAYVPYVGSPEYRERRENPTT